MYVTTSAEWPSCYGISLLGPFISICAAAHNSIDVNRDARLYLVK